MVKRQRHLHLFAGDQRLGEFMAFAMGEVQQPPSDPGLGAIGVDIIEPDRDMGHRLVAFQLQPEDRCADDIGLFHRRAVETGGEGVVAALIAAGSTSK